MKLESGVVASLFSWTICIVWQPGYSNPGRGFRLRGMATNRLEILQQMLEQDPGNTFARYGLAMEFAKSGDFGQAVAEFKNLLANDENYSAAYFHGGQALEKLGKLDEARAMYEKGIEVTTRKGDSHTRSEIEGALSLLPI